MEVKEYTVNLRGFRGTERIRRSPRALNELRNFLVKNLRLKPDSIAVDPAVNNYIWERGAKKPALSVKVKVALEKDSARAYLYDQVIPQPKPKEEKKPKAEKKAEEHVHKEGEAHEHAPEAKPEHKPAEVKKEEKPKVASKTKPKAKPEEKKE